jgi:hypothetical protein
VRWGRGRIVDLGAASPRSGRYSSFSTRLGGTLFLRLFRGWVRGLALA